MKPGEKTPFKKRKRQAEICNDWKYKKERKTRKVIALSALKATVGESLNSHLLNSTLR